MRPPTPEVLSKFAMCYPCLDARFLIYPDVERLKAFAKELALEK
jgi:hypothetical protein